MDEQALRQHSWEWHMRKFVEVTDGLGVKIDPGILETVVALNVSGIHTRQSCEGHLDWGTGAPWVDINAPGMEAQERKVRLALDQVHEAREHPGRQKVRSGSSLRKLIVSERGFKDLTLRNGVK